MNYLSFTNEESKEFNNLIQPWIDNHYIQIMKEFSQHGSISTYEHCLSVAKIAFFINRRLHLNTNEKALITGCILHDFFLYDWHTHLKENKIKDEYLYSLIKNLPNNPITKEPIGVCIGNWTHSYKHPLAAFENANALFDISNIEKDMIINHMWPLTFWRLPKYKESWIIIVADKYCALYETISKRT